MPPQRNRSRTQRTRDETGTRCGAGVRHRPRDGPRSRERRATLHQPRPRRRREGAGKPRPISQEIRRPAPTAPRSASLRIEESAPWASRLSTLTQAAAHRYRCPPTARKSGLRSISPPIRGRRSWPVRPEGRAARHPYLLQEICVAQRSAQAQAASRPDTATCRIALTSRARTVPTAGQRAFPSRIHPPYSTCGTSSISER